MVNSTRSFKFAGDVTPGGVGINERQIHQSSGLRTQCLNATLSANLAGVQAAVLFGGAAGVAVTDWTSVKVPASWQNRLIMPMTPSLFLFATAAAGAASYRFRASGLDQFGVRIVEITPWITDTIANTDFARIIYLSKVFSWLDDLEFQSVAIDSTSGTPGGPAKIQIGWSMFIDPTRIQAAAATLTVGAGGPSVVRLLGTAANWGLGSPLRLDPYGPNVPTRVPEILGAAGVSLRGKAASAGAYAIQNITTRFPVFGDLAAPNVGVAVGKSAASWQGTPHKIGFQTADAWVTKLGIELGGTSFTPLVVGDVTAPDELELNFMIRTTLGTQRQANPDLGGLRQPGSV